MSSGGLGKANSFSDREASRSASFDSASSSVKRMNSRHSDDFPIVQESSQEADGDAADLNIVPEVEPHTPSLIASDSATTLSPKRQFSGFFVSPKQTKSKVASTPSLVSRFFHRTPSSRNDTPEDGDNMSSITDGPNGSTNDESPCVEGMDVSHLLSPELSDTTSPSISQQITSMLHSSITSIKTGFEHADNADHEVEDNEHAPPVEVPPAAPVATAATPTGTVS